jgi:hypothetical protein
MKKILVYADPGHSWAKVRKEELIELGIADEISSCSYERGDYAYLEEDCDRLKYLEALRAKGIKWQFVENFTNQECRVRSYNNYNKPKNKNTAAEVYYFKMGIL